MSEGFEFSVRDGEVLTLEGAVFQALGAASVCWSSINKAGVFDSYRAKIIGETLIEFFKGESPF